jgi:hypothetical protein
MGRYRKRQSGLRAPEESTIQFGLFYEWPNPTLRQWKTLFEEGVENSSTQKPSALTTA